MIDGEAGPSRLASAVDAAAVRERSLFPAVDQLWCLSPTPSLDETRDRTNSMSLQEKTAPVCFWRIQHPSVTYQPGLVISEVIMVMLTIK